MGKLTVLAGEVTGRAHELVEERLQIGRDESCGLTADVPGLSRRHAEVVQTGFGFLLRDLGSTNGTYVNSERVTEHRLRHGDHIRVASLELLFEDAGAGEAAPPGGAVVFDRDPIQGLSLEMPAPDLTSWVRAALSPGLDTTGSSRFERRLAMLQKLSKTAGVEEEPEAFLGAALAVVLPEVMADAAVIFLADEETGKLRSAVTRRSSRMFSGAPIRVSSTVIARVMNEQVPFMASDAAKSLSGAASVKTQRIRSVICVPLKTPRALHGLFYADVRSMPGFYQPEDVSFVAAVCSHLAVNIENLFLYRRSVESRRKLEQATRQLVESEKLSALGRMSGLVAHELRTPLQTATVAVEMLRLGATPESLEMLETLDRSLDRCRRLSDNLLGYSRRPDATKVPLDLRCPLESAVDLMRVVLLKGDVELELRCPEDLPRVLGCGSDLEQLFLNLLRNAVDAVEGKGRIDIDVSTDGGHVEIVVRDTGTGIAPEHMPRVFEELYTTKPIGHGTGLGLPLCKRVVEEHGGTIALSSEPGAGTTVTVRLPVCGSK